MHGPAVRVHAARRRPRRVRRHQLPAPARRRRSGRQRWDSGRQVSSVTLVPQPLRADPARSLTTEGHVMSPTSSTAEGRSSRRRLALGVIAAAQFMVIMDTSIIGVALPELQDNLGFTPQGLSWVFNAYVVAFGGLLLLGGRLSDLFGARRIFSIGWG